MYILFSTRKNLNQTQIRSTLSSTKVKNIITNTILDSNQTNPEERTQHTHAHKIT